MSLYGDDEEEFLTVRVHKGTDHRFGEELLQPQVISPCVSGSESLGDSEAAAKEDHAHDTLAAMEIADPDTLSKYDSARAGVFVFNSINAKLFICLGAGVWKEVQFV